MEYPGTLIQNGSKNMIQVRAIKARLNELIGSTLDINNYNFGSSTEAVVKQFQKANHLIQDGKVGALTWDRLFNDYEENQPQSKDLIKRVLEIADTQLYVREKTGKNDGPDVEKYLASVGLPKSFAWCQSYMYWLFKTASSQLGVSNPMPKTAGVLDCLAKSKKAGFSITMEPKIGDQFIMDFGKGMGHTGLVTEVKGAYFESNEGNTSADPSYAGEDREGNGVFERMRKINSVKCFIRYA